MTTTTAVFVAVVVAAVVSWGVWVIGRRQPFGAAATAGIAAGIATFAWVGPTPPLLAGPYTTTICPDHDFTDSLLKDQLGNSRPVFVPVDYGDIPEFHDCQRLLVNQAGTLQYGPTVGIFVTTRDSTPPTAATPVIAVVAHLDGPDYLGLGIYKGANCLFVTGSAAGTNAIMVGPWPQYSKCALAADGTPDLNVTQKAAAHVTSLYVMDNSAQAATQVVPAVARWDFDSENQLNSIGLKCGNRWCEIGPKAPMNTTAMRPDAATNPRTAVKGWYDEQRLAEPLSKGTQLSTVTGIVVPDKDLAARDNNHYSKFLEVATATLDGDYSEWLKNGANRVELCAGTFQSCAPGETKPTEVSKSASRFSAPRRPLEEPRRRAPAARRRDQHTRLLPALRIEDPNTWF